MWFLLESDVDIDCNQNKITFEIVGSIKSVSTVTGTNNITIERDEYCNTQTSKLSVTGQRTVINPTYFLSPLKFEKSYSKIKTI